MKKYFSGVVTGCIIGLILATTTFAFGADPIKLMVNGKDISFPEAPPTIINGRTMVPARPLAEALGAKVEWDGVNRAVVVTGGVYADGTPTDLPVKQQQRQNNEPKDGKWQEGFKVNGNRLSEHTMGFYTPTNFYMEEKSLNVVLSELGLPIILADPTQDVWFNNWYFISLNRTALKFQYDEKKRDLVISSN